MTKFSGIIFFVLMLILTNEVANIEGRKVMLGKKPQTAAVKVMSLAEEGKATAGSNVASPSRNAGQIISTKDEGDVDAFRPTTPGHSPGIGH